MLNCPILLLLFHSASSETSFGSFMYIISIDNCSTQWEPARLGPAASTRTGPADGQRIGVNACHSWGEFFF